MSKLRNLFTHSATGWWTLPENASVNTPHPEAENPFGDVSSRMKRSWRLLTSSDKHATPAYYWMIGIVLAVITLLEVVLFGVDLLRSWFITIMLVMSAAKFVLVVAFFMHLRFEHKNYTRLFLVCLTIGVAIFVAFLLLKAFQGFGQ